MEKAKIVSRGEYAIRDKRLPNVPFRHVQVLGHIRGNKWKARRRTPTIRSLTKPVLHPIERGPRFQKIGLREASLTLVINYLIQQRLRILVKTGSRRKGGDQLAATRHRGLPVSLTTSALALDLSNATAPRETDALFATLVWLFAQEGR